MKNKIIILLIIFCYSHLSFGSPTIITEKAAVIDIVYTQNVFLLSEKLILLTSKNYITTSFDALSHHILTSQTNLIPSLQSLNHLLWFQNAAKANELEIQAYQNFKSSHFYSAQAKYKLAYQESLRSNKVAQQIVILRNLVLLNYLANNNNNAFNYNNLLINLLSKQSKNYNSLVKSIILQSKIALAMGNMKQAEDLIYKNALPMSNGLANKNLLFDSFLTLSQIYLKTKSYTQSKWFAIQALDLAQKKGLRDKQITGLIALAKVKSITGDYSLALENLYSANLLCPKNSLYLADIYETQYQNNRRMGNLIQAQAYLVRFLDFKKSLIN
jgi:hypothetical protein